MASGINMTPLDVYYVQRNTVEKMELPYYLKETIVRHFSLPVHPVARKMHRFFRKWKKELHMWEIKDNRTLFTSGILVTLLNKNGGTYFTDEAREISSWDDDACRSLSGGESRALTELYDICADVESHAYELPAYPTFMNNIEKYTA